MHWFSAPLSDWCHLIICRSWNCWERPGHFFSVCQFVHSLSASVFRMSLPTLQLCRESNSLLSPSLPSLPASSFINQPLLKVLKPPNPSTHLVLSLLGFFSSWLLRFLSSPCSATPAVIDTHSLSLYVSVTVSPSVFNAPQRPPSGWFCVSDHHSFDPLGLLPRRVTTVIRAERLWDAYCQHLAGKLPERQQKSGTLKHNQTVRAERKWKRL